MKKTPILGRNKVLLIKLISWSALLILNRTVTFQVTNELGPILETIPGPKGWSNKTL